MGNNIPFFILWKVEKRLLLTFNMIVVARITVKSPTMNTTTSPSVLGHITKPYCHVLLRMFIHPTTCGATVSSIWTVLHILGQAATPVLLIKRFRFYRNLLLFFEFRYYPYYYYYYYFFSGHAIIIPNLQNRITFSHQTPLIHGPLSDTLQRAFWC